MRIIKNLLPHVSLILSGMFITFFILDKLNPNMAFINNDATKLLLLLFAIVSLIVSLRLILHIRREE